MQRSKMIFAAIMAFSILILSRMSYAIPVPSGVDGTVYELDGITQVRSGIDFYVKNEASGQTIYGKTGHGSSGRYSVSIGGTAGDLITIKAWNKYNQANTTLGLNGVMSNANLFLNMTYPPIAPVIKSIPPAEAVEGKAYIYQLESFDENEEDEVIFSIVFGPDGMEIENGLLSWIPKKKDVGENTITVQASDGVFLVNQTFDITVEKAKTPPKIKSIPPDKAEVGKEYRHDIEAESDGNLSYFLDFFPSGMSIDSKGSIKWSPTLDQVGANKAMVSVTDGNYTASLEFLVIVSSPEIIDAPKPKSSGGGGGGGGGGGAPNIASIKKIEGERKSIVAIKLPVNGAEIRIDDLSERPKDAKRLDRKVYRYLIIENVKQIKLNNTEGAEINFTVSLKWLLENQINPSEIIMTRYSNNSWQDLNTSNISNDGESIHYSAKTPGFSYFAISVRDGVASNQINPQISRINAPFRFTGIIHKFLMAGKAEQGTKIFFENLNTGKTFVAQTQGSSGEYYLFIEGNENDPVKVTIEGAKKELTTGLRDRQISFMLNLRKTGFISIEGNALAAIMKDKTVASALLAFIASIIGLGFYRFHKS